MPIYNNVYSIYFVNPCVVFLGTVAWDFQKKSTSFEAELILIRGFIEKFKLHREEN